MKWKRNLNKIPPNILEDATSFGKDDCEVACVKIVREADLRSGVYAHLSISLSDCLDYEKTLLPRPESGRYSRFNLYGREIVYRDEPKVDQTWSIESPDFGDWSIGSHEVTFTREVYQRAEYPPLFLPIHIECLGHDILKATYHFKFRVGRVLNRRAASFKYDLLFDLNLLQENVGNHGLYEAGTTSQDFIKTLNITWEILPPGEREDNIAHILSGLPGDNRALRTKLVDRYDFLHRLKPVNFIKGASGFARYFGAQFSDNLVVFENIEYGNAAYVMFDDWQEVSRKSRIDLIASGTENFIRIRHTETWKLRMKAVIDQYRK